ncbi:MAG: hypothetical protein WCO09_03000, partial [bacterium]
ASVHVQNARASGDVFAAYKNEGETPLECLIRLKDEGFLPMSDKFTYAGRLDPMAEGLLIFLRGDAIQNKHDFLALPKEYEVEILLGVSTDTGDVLGLINSVVHGDVVFDLKNIGAVCESFIGESEVPYPWFSSKTLKGKPLYEWAREFASEESEGDEVEDKIESKVDGHNFKVDEVFENDESREIFLRPMTKLSIKEIEFQSLSLVSKKNLLENVTNRIRKVKGDFRQEKILRAWIDKIPVTKKDDGEYPMLKIKVKCGSGSYMRTLAELIGEKLKAPALAYSIKRISIGGYKI